ncbi:DUF4427 domain-containing protein [Pseudomonas fluorescens]|uniref:DUF4427 domain-containing protein n=1 Tax=Pseudomonas fluorescens TaxID=294 RepID=UPI00215668DA|nr:MULTISPECIES: DUF4427 domain-containing protein [Pseudomonas]MDW8843639.1 DUF4427 domain-containing protein [Pseudomonas carnis]
MKKKDGCSVPRMAHYFRAVNLLDASRPEFIPESFPSYCQFDDEEWSGGILLRIAVRMHHLWPTYGVRGGMRTIQGEHPAVCFMGFNLADLIAVRDGFTPHNAAVTQYAITFPITAALKGGLQPVIQWSNGLASLLDGALVDGLTPDDADNQYRYVGDQTTMSGKSTAHPEWRWRCPGNYRRNIKKIEANGFEDNVMPGLKITQKKWSGLGIVVPNLANARRLRYDVLTLIDQGLVSEAQFDHILVCDLLPASLEGLDEQALQAAFSNACFDFKSCRAVPAFKAGLAAMDFSTRLIVLEGSTARAPQHERGGCWLWFEDNSHPYVRKLVQAGRVKPNNKGRYLASLDELDTKRDLRERQEIVLALSEQLREKYGVKSSYFSVNYSYSPDDDPAYAGRIWGGGYFITATLDEDDE